MKNYNNAIKKHNIYLNITTHLCFLKLIIIFLKIVKPTTIMKTNKFFKILTLCVLIFTFSCAKDDFVATIGLCPLVVSTTPNANAINVPINQVITATFNKVINVETINSTSFSVSDDSAIAGAITFTSTATSTTVIFTPTSNLSLNTTYTAVLTDAVKDNTGNAMQADYVWSFSTGNIVTPRVISTNPINAATNVALDKKISATFSEKMNPATFTAASFKINNGNENIAGTFTFKGQSVIFNPTALLTSNTNYTATITTAVKNDAGVGIASNYIWTFSTGTNLLPAVISTDPVNLATNVPLNKTISATFNQVMNPQTVNNTSFTLKEGNNLVAGVFSFNGSTILFNPNASLLSATTYTATLTTAIKNAAGDGLASNYIWTFTTRTSNFGPNIGSLSLFGGFGGNAGITNQGLNTVINNGGIGTTAASTLITGFHDGLNGNVYTETPLNKGLVTGGIFTAPPFPGTAASFAIAQQAAIDANALYNSISPAAMPGGTDPGAGQLGGLTLPPGIYKSASGTFGITNGNLTLDAQGDPNAVWIFQCATALTVGIAGPTGAKSVILINGASSSKVFWQVGSAATINGAGGGIMVGTIVANSGVTISTAGNAAQSVLNGRAISLIASVTMVNTTINVP